MIPLRPLIPRWNIVAKMGAPEGNGEEGLFTPQRKKKKGRLPACRPLEKQISPAANLRYLLPMFRPTPSLQLRPTALL